MVSFFLVARLTADDDDADLDKRPFSVIEQAWYGSSLPS